MTREKIRLQRVHSESQRHLIMFRLTVHTQTTGSSYHIFLKVNVSVLTERWAGGRHFYTFLERTNWLKFSRSWNMCPFLPIASQGNHLNASALYKKMFFLQRFLSTSKNQNPTNRISGCPGCFNLAAWLRMTSGLLFIALEYKRGAPRPGHGAS